ncbi:MAG: CPBP family intramembrane metalloprotease [Maricaulis sp.]|nr:CPBP family intramembrane metalloprotease [Maricaulis sp.]
MSIMSSVAEKPSVRWPFRASDSFSGVRDTYRMPLIHSLPGVLFWPIFLFVLAYIGQLIAALIWQSSGGDASGINISTAIFLGAAGGYAALALFMWIDFQRLDAHRYAFSIFPLKISDFGAALLVMVFTLMIGSPLTQLVYESAMTNPELTISGGVTREEISNVDDFIQAGATTWAIILLTVIAAPLVEEILFRGWMLPMLMARGVPTIFAIIITSIGFALIHISQSLFVVIATFFLALALGTARVMTGRIAAPVLGHMANNAWALFAVPALLEMQAG